VEPCKQYRSTVEFNFVDSTALINAGDPCKRALNAPLVTRYAPHAAPLIGRHHRTDDVEEGVAVRARARRYRRSW